jgi:hypothetical protein
VLDKMTAFARDLQFTLNSRKAALALDSLRMYVIAKGVARDPKSVAVASLVTNMKRDLGKRGRPTKASLMKKAAAATAAATPVPSEAVVW